MMKSLFVAAIAFLLSGFLVSCSSDPVASDNSTEKVATQKPVESKKIESNVVTQKPVETSAQMSSALDAAIGSDNPERLKQAATDALSANPKDVKALNALAMYYYKKNQLDAASLLLNKASGSQSSEVSNNMGLIALARGDQREAVQMFRKAMEQNPKNYTAASNLAALYLKEKDYNKVIYSLENYVKSGDADINSLSNYGVALTATGKTAEAASIYESILKNHPDHQNTMLNYAVLLIEKQEKYKEGLDLIGRLKFVGSDIESRQVIKDLENKAKAGLK
jgi:tetratricopeptide (TPR) repeat protein